MKVRFTISLLVTCLVCMTSTGSAVKEDFPVFKGPYLRQVAPVDKAEVFLDGTISTLEMPEMCAAFSSDGKEFTFNTLYKDRWTIFQTREIDGLWIKPQPMPFSTEFTDRDFTMSPDGKRIYFGSNRPRRKGEAPLSALDIYVTERIDGGSWSEPENTGAIVNSDLGENYPSVAQNGNLYIFSSRTDGFGGCDIYVSRSIDGRRLPPENLGGAVNSEKNDWDAFIAPDESYIIFSSQNRDDTLGGQDLYICFRKSDGNWTEAGNMGSSVNSESDEICPSVSLDGRFLFFTSRRRGRADIFWIDTDIIKNMRQKK